MRSPEEQPPMKNLMLALLMFTVGAVDAKDEDKIISDSHYRCLNTIAAGLNWSGGRWVQATFNPFGEFQLEIEI